MPIEKKGYRIWSGTPKGLSHRILALSIADMRFKIRRPAVIGILAIWGVYVLISGLIPILPNLFGGENIFMDDPTPEYAAQVVPDIIVVRTDIYDGNDTIPSDYRMGEDVFDLAVPPGGTLIYTIWVVNSGYGVGPVTLTLDPAPRSGIPGQWTYDLTNAPQSKRGYEEPSRQGKDFYPVFPDGRESGGHYLPIELVSGDHMEIYLTASLSENASYDTLSLVLTAEASNDEEPYRGQWMDYAYYRSSVRFDVRPDIDPPACSLRDDVELKLVGVSHSGGTVSPDDVAGIYAAGREPVIKWNDRASFTFRITNVGSDPLYVRVAGDDLLHFETRGMYEDHGGTPGVIHIVPGAENAVSHTIEIKPTTENLPLLYYQSIVFIASPVNGGFDRDTLTSYYNEFDMPGSVDETEGKNQSLTVLPLRVSSRQMKKEDNTASYFYKVFYTGGVNIWVLIFAIIVGSGIVADDRANKTLPLYYSKAIPRFGYAVGKFVSLMAMMLLATVVLSDVWFSSIMIIGGFSWSFFTSHVWVLGALTLYGLLVSAVLSSLILAVSSLSKNRYFVGATVISLFIVSTLVGTILWGITRNEYFLLMSLSHDLRYVGEALFDIGTPPVSWWYSFAVLGGLILVSVSILYYQLVKREEVVS